jgi:uncharacterized protein YndB with AHSA1/START domain
MIEGDGAMTHHAHGAESTKITLPSDREILIERVIDAPRDLVFETITRPSLIPSWWGPRRMATLVDKMDVKPGGAWRYVQYDAECKEYAFNGTYREVVAPSRLVYTFEFEGMPGHGLTETVTLEQKDGKTVVRTRDASDSTQDRDGMLQMGMEAGAKETSERFAELLEDIQQLMPC